MKVSDLKYNLYRIVIVSNFQDYTTFKFTIIFIEQKHI